MQALIDASEGVSDSIENMKGLQRDYADTLEWLKTINRLKDLDLSSANDVSAAFSTAQSIADDPDSKADLAERQRALADLEAIIKEAKKGVVDPNTVFNSCVIANKLDFDAPALKLSAIAYFYRPTLPHRSDAQGGLGIHLWAQL